MTASERFGVEMKDNGKKPGLLYQDVLEKIRQMVLDGTYKPGDRLPSERDMAEQFGVSRVPVREAIKILEYTGMLETVPGDGVYLGSAYPVSVFPGGQGRFSLEITSGLLTDLFEMRCILESSACFYAAQRRTEEDIRKLQDIIEETKRRKAVLNSSNESDNEATYQELRVISHQFHITIIEAAHNTVLNSIYKSLYDVLEVSKSLTISQADYTFNGIIAHEFLLQKIIDRDADGARTVMLQHLDDARHKMLHTLQDEIEEEAGR